MRSIAIINQKGGVGKTTTAVNLSAALADKGWRTCLIDLDPQAHATMHFGLDQEADGATMYDVLTGNAALADAWGQAAANLWVARSHIDLAAVELDPRVRMQLMEAAEQQLLEDLPIIPIYFYVSKHLVKPRVHGYTPNIMDHHHVKHLSLSGI